MFGKREKFFLMAAPPVVYSGTLYLLAQKYGLMMATVIILGFSVGIGAILLLLIWLRARARERKEMETLKKVGVGIVMIVVFAIIIFLSFRGERMLHYRFGYEKRVEAAIEQRVGPLEERVRRLEERLDQR